MNKKIFIVPTLFLIAIVTISVTKDEESADISTAKKKLLTNLALEEAKKESSAKSQVKNSAPSLPSSEPSRRIETSQLESSDSPVKNASNVTKAKPSEVKTKRLKKRIFPPRKILAEAKKASDVKDRKESATNPGGGTTVFTGAPRTFVVTETGEGEAYLLMEAIRLLNPGDKIQLKNGTYSLIVGHLTIPDFEISGEGEETQIELPEPLKLLQQSITFKNLTLLNTSSGAAVLIRNDRRLVLENVEIRGNGNDCIEVNGGKVIITDLKLQRCNRAILLKAVSTIEGSGLNISDSDYGIYSDSSSKQSVRNLKAENINLYSVFFSSTTSGGLTCITCTLPDNMTNEKRKLIISAGP